MVKIMMTCGMCRSEFANDYIPGEKVVCPFCGPNGKPLPVAMPMEETPPEAPTDYLARAKETAHYGNHEQATAYALIAIAEELRAMRLNT